MTFLKKLAPLAALASLLMPSLALADQDVRSCCVLVENTRVTSCYQFTDAVESDEPNAPELNIVRQHQRYKCENIPYLYTDRAGETASYVANDINNSGVCGTALSTTCNSQSGIAIPLNTVHAKCQTVTDCGSSSVYACESNYCKIKANNGCVGTDGAAVNCASGLVCRTTPSGKKCLTADADVNAAGGTAVEDLDRMSGEEIGAPFVPVVPVLSIAIPGFQFTPATEIDGELQIPYLAQYINAIYRYMTAIVLTIAIVMIVYGGFRYLLASTPLGVKDGKTIITDAIIGMVLVLGAYVILNTVNPELLSLESLVISRVEAVDFEYLPLNVYASITAQSSYGGGGSPANDSAAASEAIAIARRVAQERNIDVCYMVATIQSESGGNYRAIGHDENVIRPPGHGTRARPIFERRGTTYLGRPIGAGGRNDDSPIDPTKPDYGLDMQMSHGLGIGQVTIGKTMCGERSTCDVYQCEKNGQLIYGAKLRDGICYSIPDLLTLEGGINAMSNYLVNKLSAARGNVALARGFYVGYVRRNRDGSLSNPNWETDTRTVNFMRRYNACRSGGGS